MSRDFRTELVAVLGQLSTIDALNCGGCGIAALAIKQWVDREFPEKEAQIVYLFNDFDIRNNKANLLNNNAGSCMHAMVLIDGKYYDSERYGVDLHEVPNYESLIETFEPSANLVMTSVQHVALWNCWFERSNVTNIANICGLDDSFVKEVRKLEVVA